MAQRRLDKSNPHDVMHFMLLDSEYSNVCLLLHYSLYLFLATFLVLLIATFCSIYTGFLFGLLWAMMGSAAGFGLSEGIFFIIFNANFSSLAEQMEARDQQAASDPSKTLYSAPDGRGMTGRLSDCFFSMLKPITNFFQDGEHQPHEYQL